MMANQLQGVTHTFLKTTIIMSSKSFVECGTFFCVFLGTKSHLLAKKHHGYRTPLAQTCWSGTAGSTHLKENASNEKVNYHFIILADFKHVNSLTTQECVLFSLKKELA